MRCAQNSLRPPAIWQTPPLVFARRQPVAAAIKDARLPPLSFISRACYLLLPTRHLRGQICCLLGMIQIASCVTPNSARKHPFVMLSRVFLLNITDDFSLFVIYPEQSSYNCTTCCKHLAFSSLTFKRSRESSANKRCVIVGVESHIEMPLIFPSALAEWCRKTFNRNKKKM